MRPVDHTSSLLTLWYQKVFQHSSVNKTICQQKSARSIFQRSQVLLTFLHLQFFSIDWIIPLRNLGIKLGAVGQIVFHFKRILMECKPDRNFNCLITHL